MNLLQYCTYLTDGACTEAQVSSFEVVMREGLDNMTVTDPTVLSFFTHFQSTFAREKGNGSIPETQHFLTNYIAESMLLEYSMLKYNPSMVAAASIRLARRMLRRAKPNRACWTKDLEDYTGYKDTDLHACELDICGRLLALHGEADKLFFYRKYSMLKYDAVSLLKLPLLEVQGEVMVANYEHGRAVAFANGA
jgi:cyclin A